MYRTIPNKKGPNYQKKIVKEKTKKGLKNCHAERNETKSG